MQGNQPIDERTKTNESVTQLSLNPLHHIYAPGVALILSGIMINENFN